MPESARTTSCMKPLPPNSADHFYRHAVLPDDDGRVGDDAAERHIAGAHLLGDIDAAAAGGEIHGEAGLRK